METSLSLYHKTRQRVKERIVELRRAGHDRVRIVGGGDVADICRLTCLEAGIAVVSEKSAPALVVEGFKIHLRMEGDE